MVGTRSFSQSESGSGSKVSLDFEIVIKSNFTILHNQEAKTL